jgi:hypothetical protein
MSGLANTSDTEQRTSLAKQSAGHADDVTMLGISKRDILRLGGIWPPVGTTPKTATETFCPNAWPAICTTKGVSGLSVDDLTKLSKAELRRLCEIQNRLDRMEWQSCVSSPTITNQSARDSFWRNLPSMSEEIKQKHITELRGERRRILAAEHTSHYSAQMARVNRKLFALTGLIIYADADDTA